MGGNRAPAPFGNAPLGLGFYGLCQVRRPAHTLTPTLSRKRERESNPLSPERGEGWGEGRWRTNTVLAPSLSKPGRLSCRLAIAIALCAWPAVQAQPSRDASSGCAVHTSGYLAGDDYTLAYTGGCQDGLAHGEGQAVWSLKYSESKKITWKGRFNQGVYQPPPLVDAKGRLIARGKVLFELGDMPGAGNIGGARLNAIAGYEMTDYASACRPDSLYVTAPSAQGLEQDDNVQALMRGAVALLRKRCGAAFEVNDKQGRPKSGLRVQLLDRHDLTPDRYQNLPDAVAHGYAPLEGDGAIQNYNNRAANQARRQQEAKTAQAEREATLARLKTFFDRHGGQAWVPLGQVAQNPFRYADQVVVGAARLVEVVSPTQAIVEPVGGDWSRLLVEGRGIAQWEPGSRILAVKPRGRLEAPDKNQGLVRLELVGVEACKAGNCADWLDVGRNVIQPGWRP